MDKTIITSTGTSVIEELDRKCQHCILNQERDYAHITCSKYKDSRRVGYFEGNHGKIYACSKDAKTTKNFKTEMSSLIEMLPYINKMSTELETEAAQKSEKRYQQLVHNLKTINANCIQEIYDLAPSGNVKNPKDAIYRTIDVIKKDLQGSAMVIFHLLKYFSMMKTDFFVYDRTYTDKKELSFDNYKVQLLYNNERPEAFI